MRLTKTSANHIIKHIDIMSMASFCIVCSRGAEVLFLFLGDLTKKRRLAQEQRQKGRFLTVWNKALAKPRNTDPCSALVEGTSPKLEWLVVAEGSLNAASLALPRECINTSFECSSSTASARRKSGNDAAYSPCNKKKQL